MRTPFDPERRVALKSVINSKAPSSYSAHKKSEE